MNTPSKINLARAGAVTGLGLSSALTLGIGASVLTWVAMTALGSKRADVDKAAIVAGVGGALLLPLVAGGVLTGAVAARRAQ